MSVDVRLSIQEVRASIAEASLETIDESLEARLSEEESRADAAELSLETDLSIEISRATNTEESIDMNLSDAIIFVASSLESAISNETARAIDAENSLEDDVSSVLSAQLSADDSLLSSVLQLSSEVSNTTSIALSATLSASTQVSVEVSTFNALESGLIAAQSATAEQVGLTIEILDADVEMVLADAFANFTELNSDIFDLNSALATEIARATVAETSLESRLSAEEARALLEDSLQSDALSVEIATRNTSLQLLRTDRDDTNAILADVSNALLSEIDRAVSVEADLDVLVDSVEVNLINATESLDVRVSDVEDRAVVLETEVYGRPVTFAADEAFSCTPSTCETISAARACFVDTGSFVSPWVTLNTLSKRVRSYLESPSDWAISGDGTDLADPGSVNVVSVNFYPVLFNSTEVRDNVCLDIELVISGTTVNDRRRRRTAVTASDLAQLVQDSVGSSDLSTLNIVPSVADNQTRLQELVEQLELELAVLQQAALNRDVDASNTFDQQLAASASKTQEDTDTANDVAIAAIAVGLANFVVLSIVAFVLFRRPKKGGQVAAAAAPSSRGSKSNRPGSLKPAGASASSMAQPPVSSWAALGASTPVRAWADDTDEELGFGERSNVQNPLFSDDDDPNDRVASLIANVATEEEDLPPELRQARGSYIGIDAGNEPTKERKLSKSSLPGTLLEEPDAGEDPSAGGDSSAPAGGVADQEFSSVMQALYAGAGDGGQGEY